MAINQKKRKCVPSKEKIHALAAFAKEQMAKEVNKVDEELKNFKNMSVSDNGSAWKIGLGLAKLCECFVTTINDNLAIWNNKFKFNSLDECLNSSFAMSNYMKCHKNQHKRQRTEPTKLVPISFIKLKIKREKMIISR